MTPVRSAIISSKSNPDSLQDRSEIEPVGWVDWRKFSFKNMKKPFKFLLFGLNNIEIPRILLYGPETCFFLLVHLKVQRIGSSETQEE